MEEIENIMPQPNINIETKLLQDVLSAWSAIPDKELLLIGRYLHKAFDEIRTFFQSYQH